MTLNDIHPNPKNPRTLRDERGEWLYDSMEEFGDLSGFVFNRDGMTISGHQRWEKIKHKVLQLVVSESFDAPLPDGTIQRGHFKMKDGRRYDYSVRDWPQDKADRATIRANAENAGDWAGDVLTSEWSVYEPEELKEMGVPEYVFEDLGGGTDVEVVTQVKAETRQWVPDCLFPSNNLYEIPTLDFNMQAENVSNPVIIWGAEKRTRKIKGGTVLFYVDDYRFEAIWGNPLQVTETGCSVIAEPNLSIYDTMPVSYALHLIYKKRWIARYLQSLGVRVLVDMNVSVKFSEYNLLGVPDGWNAFATRGYVDRMEYLEHEIELAKKVSGKDSPFMVVYGGGLKIREVVARHNLIYIEQFRGFDKKSKI